jgi:hypothetical protein
MPDDELKRHTGEDEAALLRSLRTASIGTHVAQLRVIHRLKQGLDDGCDQPEGVAAACPDAESRDGASVSEAMFDIAKLQVETYNRLLEIGRGHGDRLMRNLRDRMQARRRPRTQHCEVLETSGALNGPSDPKVFCIVNRLRRTATIVFDVGDFADLRGGMRPFKAEVKFFAEPPIVGSDELCLASGESRFFRMEIASLAPPFASGQSYAATLRVRLDGCTLEERLIRVVVR